MNDNVRPRGIWKNKGVKIVRRTQTKQFGRKGVAVGNVIKLDRVSPVFDVRGFLTRRPKPEWVRMDPRGVTRIDSILNNHLGGLFDGCFEPRGIETGLEHVWNLGRLGSL
jgi:hypothetical protein